MKIRKKTIFMMSKDDVDLMMDDPQNFWRNVNKIGERAFADCNSIILLNYLPNHIESVESYAFQNCKNMKEITLPQSVTSLGTNIFEGCDKLEKITFRNKNIEGLSGALKGFNFDSILESAHELTFVRNKEKEIDEERE